MDMKAYWKAVRTFLEKILNSGKNWWEIAADLYNSDNDSIIKNGFVQLFGLDGMLVTSSCDGDFICTCENGKITYQGRSYQKISEHLSKNFGFVFNPVGDSTHVMSGTAHNITVTLTIDYGYLHRVSVSFNMSKIEKDRSKAFWYKEEDNNEETDRRDHGSTSWKCFRYESSPRSYPPRHANEEDYW